MDTEAVAKEYLHYAGLSCVEKHRAPYYSLRLCGEHLLEKLLAFAAQQVTQARRETWETMMPYLTHRLGCPWFTGDTATFSRHCACGFEDVRRRAQENQNA